MFDPTAVDRLICAHKTKLDPAVPGQKEQPAGCAIMPAMIDPPIGKALPRDWATVRSLTVELDGTEKIGSAIKQWDFAVRLFRQVEESRFYEQEPTENDKANHRALLFFLIGLGRLLEVQTIDFPDERFAKLGFTRADLRAAIEDLEDDFFQWYVPDFEPAKSAELQQKIFGGQT